MGVRNHATFFLLTLFLWSMVAHLPLMAQVNTSDSLEIAKSINQAHDHLIKHNYPEAVRLAQQGLDQSVKLDFKWGLVNSLLILGQSQIVGFSGSTFQNVARLRGQYAPITQIAVPPGINFSALQDVIRWTKNRQLSMLQVCDIAKEMMEAQRLQDAMELLGAALEIYSGADRFVILHNMSAYLLEGGRAVQALIYAKAALEIIPGNPQVLLLIHRIESSTSA